MGAVDQFLFNHLQQATEVVIVDWTVTDYQTLIKDINPNTPVIVLQPGQSGLAGLAKVLAGFENLDAIHLVTHGWGGALQLGGQMVTDQTLQTQANDVQAIANALKAGGDLMLYGCSVAAGSTGQQFVGDLVKVLGDVDVVASTDKTGPTQLGGDWDLEWHSGDVETVLPFSLQGMQDISHCLGCTTVSIVPVTNVTATFPYGTYTVTHNIYGKDGTTLYGHQWTGYGNPTGIYNEFVKPESRSSDPHRTHWNLDITSQTDIDFLITQLYCPDSNAAPTLSDTTLSFAAVNENAAAPSGAVGALVSSIVAIGTNVTDGDSGAVTGVAITATDTTNGSWWHSTDNGTNWSSVGTVSNSSALLLGTANRIYFQPTANYVGNVSTGVTFRAWDTTTGSIGSKVDTSTNGGTTAFSTATDKVSITVSDVDPSITASQSFNVAENSAASTAVGTVAKTGDTNGLIWSITGGTGQSLFDIDSSTGAITVANGATLNYEGTNSYTLTVAVDDEDVDSTADSTQTVTINLTNVNEVPTLTATGATPTFTQGSGTGVDLFSSVTASTVDGSQTFAGAKFTVTNVSDTTEYLTIDGTDVALTHGNSASVSGGSNNASVSVSGSTATVTITGLTLSNANMATLIDGVTYKNTDASATQADRVVTLTEMTDSGSSNATATLTGVAATVTVSVPSTDATSTVTASATLTEPSTFATTAVAAGSAVGLLDFTLADAGTADGVATTVTSFTVDVSGTTTHAERGNMVFLLNGPDATNVQGTYDSGTGKITFSGLSISVANAGSETYTISGYYNDNTGTNDLVEGHTLILSVDGDANFTTGAGSSTVAASQAAVTNGAGAAVDVTATQLVYSQGPSGTVTSGVAFGTQPVVLAVDARGNVDTGYTGNVALTENGSGTLGGTATVAATAGVATFSGLKYNAASDADANFTLTAASGTLTDATISNLNPDVVATKLFFGTQPAPTSIGSGQSTTFTTVPVVNAVDADNLVDTDYTTAVVLDVTDPNDGTVDGTVNSLTGTGDTDGAGTTVTLTPTSGVATFTGLALQYTNTAASESIALRATSGSLTAANSSTITSATNAASVVDLNGTGTVGTGNTVTLANAANGLAAASAVVSDTENDATGWNGSTMSVQRIKTGGAADGCAHDVFSFTSGGSFTTTGGAIAQGSNANGTLLTSPGSTQFATWTYTSATGKLDISFDANATSALVQDVVRHVGYSNARPYGDATLRLALNDGTSTTNSDVTVTSTTIHVDQTALDADGDAADGFNLKEALAIAKDGDTILIHDGAYRGQFVATTAVTIDAFSGASGSVTLEAPDRADLAYSSQSTINGRLRAPILDIRQTDPAGGTVNVKNISVDGRYQAHSNSTNSHANGTEDLIGIGVYNSNATIDAVHISHIATTVDGVSGDYNGFSENFGVLAEGSSALASQVTVTVKNSTIDTYQKTGILAWGPQLNVDIRDNTITGVGVHGVSNQNGMQIGSGGTRGGTTGVVSGNTINGLDTISPVYSATAILLREAGSLEIKNNDISVTRDPDQNQTTGVSLMDVTSPVNIHDNTFTKLNSGIYIEELFSPAGNVAHTVGNNNFNSTYSAITDVTSSGPTAASTVVINSAATVTNGRGFLDYQFDDGNDSFSDTGSAPTHVSGGAGNDTLATGSGADELTGGAGNDALTGGVGNDVFKYAGTGNDVDVISDFGTGDAIQVAGRASVGGTVTSGTGTTVAVNSVQVSSSGGVTTLYIDSDATADGPEVEIQLTGTYVPGNFILDGEYIRCRSATTFGSLALSDDTGLSTTDFITKTASQTITSTLSAALAVGDVVWGSLDGGATWTDVTNKVSGTTLTWNGLTLSGSNTLKLKVTDSANVDGVVTSQAYEIDATAPVQTFSALTFSADTGASTIDFITNTAAQTIGATLSGPLSASEKVFGSLDGGTTWTDITAMVTGTTLSWTGVTLTGSNTLKFKVSDVAGNDGTVSSQAYTLDTTAPVFQPATSTPADNATTFGIGNNIVVKLDERLDASSDLTKVYLKDVATDTLVPATITLDANGNIVINPTGNLDFSKAYYVTWDANALKDLAGNAVAAVADETTFNFTTEAAPPPEPDPVPTPAPAPSPPPAGDDGDGVSNTVESQVPALPGSGGSAVAGDGNGDGVSDAQQASVSSTQFRVTETISTDQTAPPTYVTLVADSNSGKATTGTASITEIKQLDAPANMPAEMTSPLGLISFKATVAQTGSNESFSLYVDPALGVNGYWKQSATGAWVNLASAAYGGGMVLEGGKLRLDFHVVDGGEFDSDGVANGSISDPGIVGSLPLSITEHHPKLVGLDGFWF